MDHILFDQGIPELPEFMSIWEEGIDKIVRDRCSKIGKPVDYDDPESALVGHCWNRLSDHEERFCTKPHIAVHVFSKQRFVWLVADPTKPNHDQPVFTDKFDSLKQVAEYLIKIGYLEEQTLFPNRIGETLRPQNIDRTQIYGSGHTPNGRTIPHPPANTSQAEGGSNGHARTPTNPRFDPQPGAGAYPLDLLLRLRRSYSARNPGDVESFQIALELIRTHSNKRVAKTSEHTLFHGFDAKQPQASLKAIYYPHLRWSIEIDGPAEAKISLPSQLTAASHVHTLLEDWHRFKEHLPLYQTAIPQEHPGIPSDETEAQERNAQYPFLPDSGFIVQDANPLLTFESARQLNELLDPDSSAQKRLIKACLVQARQLLSDQTGLLPVVAQPPAHHQNHQPSNAPQYYTSEACRLEAFAYTLTLNNHRAPETHLRLPDLQIDQAIALLSIKATELTAPASAGQSVLYRRITNAFRHSQQPLSDDHKQALAHLFPRTCQNQDLIQYTVEEQRILPHDSQTRYNLIAYACANADPKLLHSLMKLAREQGATTQFKKGEASRLSKFILQKAYPDRERARRCLQHLPLSPLTRISVTSQLRKSDWNSTAPVPSVNI